MSWRTPRHLMSRYCVARAVLSRAAGSRGAATALEASSARNPADVPATASKAQKRMVFFCKARCRAAASAVEPCSQSR